MCVSVCVSIYIYIYIEREVNYNILAHAVMDAEKPHYLLSASWRPRKAGDVAQRVESQRADSVDSNPGLKAWKQEHQWQERWMLQPKQSSPVN